MNITEFIDKYWIAVLVAGYIIEHILLFSKINTYYKVGIPLYYKKIKLNNTELNSKYHKHNFSRLLSKGGYELRKIGPGKYVCHANRRYMMLRWYLHIDKEAQHFIIKGNVLWISLFFIPLIFIGHSIAIAIFVFMIFSIPFEAGNINSIEENIENLFNSEEINKAVKYFDKRSGTV